MGFFNKPGKATKGFVNKVVREVDRVVMTNNQFQREYGTPPAPQQQVINTLPAEYISNALDHEFPQYMMRNRCGLIIPLPDYYKTHPLRFIIFTTEPIAIRRCKEYLNAFVVGEKNTEYVRYIITNMEVMKCPRSIKMFDTVVSYYRHNH